MFNRIPPIGLGSHPELGLHETPLINFPRRSWKRLIPLLSRFPYCGEQVLATSTHRDPFGWIASDDPALAPKMIGRVRFIGSKRKLPTKLRDARDL
jgi:hypothetical protein